jgi:hypothetical protein
MKQVHSINAHFSAAQGSGDINLSEGLQELSYMVDSLENKSQLQGFHTTLSFLDQIMGKDNKQWNQGINRFSQEYDKIMASGNLFTKTNKIEIARAIKELSIASPKLNMQDAVDILSGALHSNRNTPSKDSAEGELLATLSILGSNGLSVSITEITNTDPKTEADIRAWK